LNQRLWYSALIVEHNVQEIYHSFKGKLIGSLPMKMHVCLTLSLMPQDVIHFITTNCWFLGSMEDAWAFAFTGSDIKNDHLIFLSDELLMQDESQIHYSIAHEIGHVMLNHRNSILTKQTKGEIQKQEQEADVFAHTYVLVK
jgi:hypothetical protein